MRKAATEKGNHQENLGTDRPRFGPGPKSLTGTNQNPVVTGLWRLCEYKVVRSRCSEISKFGKLPSAHLHCAR